MHTLVQKAKIMMPSCLLCKTAIFFSIDVVAAVYVALGFGFTAVHPMLEGTLPGLMLFTPDTL